ncbi:hypothetical protein [Ostreibacterium oceani]|uniref:Uncharacterized protein n=1 Tax=Ostreibacterium oceani TaxID=2654998 RepID=A0A6N7ETG7_9GAMM|nr:hypothetical protein [Ostreibacterium oceani]MPV85233.1 hypothetical protein [Ostreibacterium oceani]
MLPFYKLCINYNENQGVQRTSKWCHSVCYRYILQLMTLLMLVAVVMPQNVLAKPIPSDYTRFEVADIQINGDKGTIFITVETLKADADLHWDIKPVAYQLRIKDVTKSNAMLTGTPPVFGGDVTVSARQAAKHRCKEGVTGCVELDFYTIEMPFQVIDDGFYQFDVSYFSDKVESRPYVMFIFDGEITVWELLRNVQMLDEKSLDGIISSAFELVARKKVEKKLPHLVAERDQLRKELTQLSNQLWQQSNLDYKDVEYDVKRKLVRQKEDEIRAKYRPRSRAINAKLEAEYEVQLQRIQTLYEERVGIVPQALVPQPKALAQPLQAGEETLAGIDSDGDGVRDDVQIAIYNRYPNDEEKRNALTLMAIDIQKVVVLGAEGDENKIFSHGLDDKPIQCLDETFGDDGYNELGFIQIIVLNTPERFNASLDFDFALDGSFFTAKNYENPCEQ